MKLGFSLGLLAVIAHTPDTGAASSSNGLMNAVRDHHKKLSFGISSPSLLGPKTSVLEPHSTDSSDEEEEKGALIVDPRGGAAAASDSESMVDSLVQRLKIGFYFALWYALNIVYNSKLPIFCYAR